MDSDDWADWGEAYRLMEQLCLDSTSHVAAALAGWTRPMTDAAMVLSDLYDLQGKRTEWKGPKPKPYPRVWDKPRPHGVAVSIEEFKRLRAEHQGQAVNDG